MLVPEPHVYDVSLTCIIIMSRFAGAANVQYDLSS